MRTKRNKPNKPNFNNNAASNNDKDVEASAWTSGNQKLNGKLGILIKNINITNNNPKLDNELDDKINNEIIPIINENEPINE